MKEDIGRQRRDEREVRGSAPRWPIAVHFFALAFLASHEVVAQADNARKEGRARISGVVHDSIAHAPLRDALVQLVAGEFIQTATTDTLGGFILDDVPPGRYTLGFLHPVLDSIGIEGPLREVTVQDATPLTVDLAVPSAGRLRRAICGSSLAPDGAVITGSVRDATTGKPVPGVTVNGEWLEYVLNRTGMSRRLGHLAAVTGDNGWYALCNVPGSGVVALTAVKETDSTGVVEVQMPPGGYARREMYIGARATGGGRVEGKVVSVARGLPLSDAQVLILNGPATRTNDRGEFLFVNAPLGTQMLEVRALGYYPHRRQVNVITEAVPLNVALSTLEAVLDTVRIIARRLPTGPDDGGFARRRRMGLGKFVGPADMARFPVISTTDLFRRMSGIRLDNGKLKMRGAFPSQQGQVGGDFWCEASIFVDGINMSFMSAEDINDWVNPDHVAGIEIYTEGTVPPQFQVGLGGCGSVVIWTK